MGLLRRVVSVLVCAVAAAAVPAVSWAQGGISGTKHNLSVSGPGPVQATSQTQICVFCHTPHGANNFPGAPLWNRQQSSATYTTYTSSSLDAEDIRGAQLAQPGGSSKLCLSCHDGTLAIGNVNNAPGSGMGSSIDMQGTAGDGTMPGGAGTQTGFTRNLGTDLTNDHPISVTFDTQLVNADGELVDPGASHIAADGQGAVIPLEATGSGGDLQVQCATCHDPHVAATDGKFLRANRFQKADPTGGGFSEVDDQICIACHDKAGWETSAHAISTVADETYADISLRDFPSGISVAEVGCLNCHDAHTVHGARRLLREGTDSTVTPKSGGSSAIEETCYQCHTNDSETVLSLTGNEVPDIETEFNLLRHMPITTAEQAASTEVHDIGTGSDADEGDQRGKDFIEDETLLGKGNLTNRHAECTDCHNPHRVMKNTVYDGSGSSAQATHDHSAPHSNTASGVLRGAWGVEPVYGSSDFLALPDSYTLLRGDPSTASQVVTKEYQICLKCHSDYAYNDDGSFTNGGDGSGRPELGAPGTPRGTNDMTTYTNQAMEFQAPLADKGEPGGNHRSWHPVIDDTGRDLSARGIGGNDPFLTPWDGGDVGSQTMYCSDCHGRDTANGTAVPPGDRPWGPHGSENDFLLKGDWNANTGSGQQDDLCFKCHEYDAYGNPDTSDGFDSGFMTDRGNGHYVHNTDDKMDVGIECTWCHVAVPHGWKNKAFLVDLNDVGPEAGQSAGTEVGGLPYTNGPYYLNAFLKIQNWATSGSWSEGDCGSDSGEIGVTWMTDVCQPE